MLIYKICTRIYWQEAQVKGVFGGVPIDHRDGFIHFSTAEQLTETAQKHFAGQRDLVLLTIESETLGEALKFEPSRGGALFPHLYGPLPLAAIHTAEPFIAPIAREA